MDSYERGKLPVKIEGLTVEAVTDRAALRACGEQ